MTAFGAPGFDFSTINATKFAEIWNTFDADSEFESMVYMFISSNSSRLSLNREWIH